MYPQVAYRHKEKHLGKHAFPKRESPPEQVSQDSCKKIAESMQELLYGIRVHMRMQRKYAGSGAIPRDLRTEKIH